METRINFKSIIGNSGRYSIKKWFNLWRHKYVLSRLNKKLERLEYREEYYSLLNEYRIRILKVISVILIVGVIVNCISNLVWRDYFIAGLGAIAVIANMLILRQVLKKRDGSRGLMMLLSVIVAFIFTVMLYCAISGNQYSSDKMVLFVLLCCILSIVAGIIPIHFLSLIISAGTVIVLIVSCLIIKDYTLLKKTPVLAWTLLGSSIIIMNLRSAVEKDKKNFSQVTEQAQIKQFAKLDPEEWQMIKGKNASDGDIKQILTKMGGEVQEKIINHTKALIANEIEITNILKKRHPDLTTVELQTCCLIIRGKTVSEISTLRHVSISTVTSIRCRLRKKVGLTGKESLKNYLMSILYDHIMDN